jgi:hypothetical protein
MIFMGADSVWLQVHQLGTHAAIFRRQAAAKPE